ncbi:MAG: chemotaxis protein CheW [Candidatus Delongbacteria bacterium]
MSTLDRLIADAEDSVDTLDQKHLTFRLGSEDYGIPIAAVIEIIGIQPITDLPEVPPWIRGVVNLRGRVVPVMDVRLRFGMPARDYDDRTCIIVASMNGENVGLIVDAVREVMSIPPEQVTAPPSVGSSAANQYIHGLGMTGERVVILLDTGRLLYGEAHERLGAALR